MGKLFKFTVLSKERLERAISRARELRPKVEIVSLDDRQFLVHSKNHEDKIYLVEFDVVVTGGVTERRGCCWEAERVDGVVFKNDYCLGFSSHGHCYHLAAAAGVNAGLQAIRAKQEKAA